MQLKCLHFGIIRKVVPAQASRVRGARPSKSTCTARSSGRSWISDIALQSRVALLFRHSDKVLCDSTRLAAAWLVALLVCPLLPLVSYDKNATTD